MLNQKKVEIFLAKFRKSLAKQFLEIAIILYLSAFYSSITGILSTLNDIIEYNHGENISLESKFFRPRVNKTWSYTYTHSLQEEI